MAPWKSHGQFNGWITSSGSCKFHLTGVSIIKEFYRQSHNLYRNNNVPNQAVFTYMNMCMNTCNLLTHDIVVLDYTYNISAHACLKMGLRMCDSNKFDSHALTQINKQKMKKYYVYYFFYLLHSSPNCILLTFSIPVVSMHFHSQFKTVWILIRWRRQKPADLDIQCFHKR